MKISKYTFFFNIDGKEYYTYNTLSNLSSTYKCNFLGADNKQ